MSCDLSVLYDDADLFFRHAGVSSMKLTATAALEVCQKALAFGVMVTRVEGGIWHNPGFEARVDCIWDGCSPPITQNDARANNCRAADFVVMESKAHDVFVITTAPLTGWWRDGHIPTL